MEDRQNLVASDVQTTHDKLTETRNRRIELDARLKRLKASLGRGPDKIDPAVMAEHAALNAAGDRASEQEARARCLGGEVRRAAPHHEDARRRDRVLEAQLAAEKRKSSRPPSSTCSRPTRSSRVLRAAANDAHSAGLNLNLREIEYRRLTHDRDNKTKLYEIVLQRLTETDLTRMLKTTHVRVLDRALLPVAPVSPNFMKNVGSSLLAGLLLGSQRPSSQAGSTAPFVRSNRWRASASRCSG